MEKQQIKTAPIPWWLTPFIKHRYVTIRDTIYYPEGHMFIPPHILAHEMVHVAQWKRLGSILFLLWYFVLPLPLFFTGRWFLEREAFMAERGLDIPTTVDSLWWDYWFVWPRCLMRRWFEKQDKPDND